MSQWRVLPRWAGGIEQSIISGVSGGSVTLPLAYPYTNIAIFKGGPCGTYISFSANLALSGYRTTYHAIASFAGSDLIYASPSGSGLNGAIQGTLPQAGVEPETHGTERPERGLPDLLRCGDHRQPLYREHAAD